MIRHEAARGDRGAPTDSGKAGRGSKSFPHPDPLPQAEEGPENHLATGREPVFLHSPLEGGGTEERRALTSDWTACQNPWAHPWPSDIGFVLCRRGTWLRFVPARNLASFCTGAELGFVLHRRELASFSAGASWLRFPPARKLASFCTGASWLRFPPARNLTSFSAGAELDFVFRRRESWLRFPPARKLATFARFFLRSNDLLPGQERSFGDAVHEGFASFGDTVSGNKEPGRIKARRPWTQPGL